MERRRWIEERRSGRRWIEERRGGRRWVEERRSGTEKMGRGTEKRNGKDGYMNGEDGVVLYVQFVICMAVLEEEENINKLIIE